MRLPAALCSLALLLVPGASACAAAAHPTAEDVVMLASATAPALSPDGTRAVFVRGTASFDSTAGPDGDEAKAGWKRDRQLWLVTLATGETRALTTGDAAPSAPCWSPDSRTIAFVRRSGERAVLQVLDLGGGEPRTLDTGRLEPQDLRFSPDGVTIAFTAERPPGDDEKRAKWARGGATEWEGEFRSAHLWVISAAGGVAREVTTGPEHVVAFEWAPDGRRFALVTSASADAYLASTEQAARIVDTLGAVLHSLAGQQGVYESVAWSPDGRRVALLGLNGGLSDMNALLVWDASGDTARDIAGGPDRSFGSLAWSADSRSLVAVDRARTETKLWRFPLTGAPVLLPFAGRVITSALDHDTARGTLAFLSSTDREPDEITTYDVRRGRMLVATHLNPQAASWTLATQKRVRWRNAEGVEIEGLFTRPADLAPGVRAPLVVMPHGGPDDVTAERFSAQAHYFAARGYAVFRPNYRGSLGYGFAFYAANRNRFGEIEQADIESGVDALIASGDADSTQLFFGGWSWGGYLTAWTIGHVHRYRAAVAGAAVSDVMLSYSLSDINHGISAQWEYRGDPWRQLEHFDRVNPIRYAKDITTPTLILHGDADARVPFAESIELFRALRDMGREVKFWAYPREDHGFVEPAHRVHYLRAWIDWYDAHAPARPVAP